MAFPCTACGACCRRVGAIPGFPEPVRSDGSCSHLTADNRCAIYERRPPICRVDQTLATLTARGLPLTREAWYRDNAELCNRWQAEDGMGPEFRVLV